MHIYICVGEGGKVQLAGAFLASIILTHIEGRGREGCRGRESAVAGLSYPADDAYKAKAAQAFPSSYFSRCTLVSGRYA